MKAVGFITFCLVFVLALAFSAQPSQAQNPRSYGASNPFALEDLPPGRLRQNIERLPRAARARALGWLHRFDFSDQDLPYIRVDRGGGVFYEDPVAEDRTIEEGGDSGPALEEVTFAEAFTLHSNPGASRTVYLDMDGHVVSGTIWNNSADPLYMRPYDTNSDDSIFTQSELNDVAETWKRVAEDFAPYNIDVTTEEPSSFGPNVGHILVTRKADEFGRQIYGCSCGGVAYVGVWGLSNYTYYQPALVFLDGVGGPHNISEAASHELGHNLYLSHDGTPGSGYYQGHGSGNTDWGPIMGVGYYAQVTQWSKGEYANANNSQDDLDIIRGYLNYRADDHEDVDFGAATPLTVTGGTTVSATNPVTDPVNANPINKGIIEDRSDVDLFYVDVGDGTIDLTVTPAWVAAYASQSRRGMNPDLRATLFDEFGFLVSESDPTNDTYARIDVAVGAGRYILAIEGVGVGDPLTTGYSDYASIGQYFINGTVPVDSIPTTPPSAPDDLVALLDGDTDIFLTWTDPASLPESNEDGYRVWRQTDGGGFVQIANIARDSASYADNNLPSGFYSYRVEPYNTAGSNFSTTTVPIEIWAPWAAHATSEISMDGAIVSGSYIDTTTSSGYERLVERHQGGKPKNRVSKLEHVWNVTGVAAAAQVTLEIDAEAPGNSDGDDFELAYSINNGPYVTFDVLSNGTGRQIMSSPLPSDASGTVRIRVKDTDRTTGNGTTNTVDVHRIEILSAGAEGDQVPVVGITAPTNGHTAEEGTSIPFSASAMDNEDGDLSGAIQWSSDIDGHIGSGPSVSVATLSVGSHTVSAAATDSASNTGSDNVSVTVTGAPSGGISLSVAAGKRKGRHTPELSWSGASGNSVDIYRDGGLVTATENDGFYRDSTGAKGSRTYAYKVCEAGTNTCSNEASVVY